MTIKFHYGETWDLSDSGVGPALPFCCILAIFPRRVLCVKRHCRMSEHLWTQPEGCCLNLTVGKEGWVQQPLRRSIQDGHTVSVSWSSSAELTQLYQYNHRTASFHCNSGHNVVWLFSDNCSYQCSLTYSHLTYLYKNLSGIWVQKFYIMAVLAWGSTCRYTSCTLQWDSWV